MKKAILILGLLFLVGCGQKNLTWTPTAEEWQLMSSTERNDWYRSENEARYRKAEAWQRAVDSLPTESEIYGRYEAEARQRNRDNDLGSIEQSLREMSRYQKYGY